jgi:hypothetical protein
MEQESHMTEGLVDSGDKGHSLAPFVDRRVSLCIFQLAAREHSVSCPQPKGVFAR